MYRALDTSYGENKTKDIQATMIVNEPETQNNENEKVNKPKELLVF